MSLDYQRIEELERQLDDNHAEIKQVIKEMFPLHPISGEQKQELKRRYDSFEKRARELHSALAEAFKTA